MYIRNEVLLAYPDSNILFEINPYASTMQLCAVILKRGNLIAFYSGHPTQINVIIQKLNMKYYP